MTGQEGGAVAAVSSSGIRARGYRTRRPMRAVLLAVILASAAGVVWLSALHQGEGGCQRAEPNAAQPAASQRLSPDGLDAVLPAPPQFTRVQVLNANGMRGKATVVDGALAQLGFAPTATPTNDPQYPGFDLHCYGEIRFGTAGQAAARTLSLAVPCAELVRDVRPDAGIDLALGTKFFALQPNDAARAALLDLAGLGKPASAGPSHGGLAAQPEPPSVPAVNPDLLRRARQVKC
jgi:LytR cell envelope-related transcriptional attenuator